jgi:hypothetical protein
MGHSRIGTLPRTRWWDEVVELLVKGVDVSQVADTTLWAAQKALATVVNDVGFREAMYLAAQLALAVRSKDAATHLAGVGVELGDGYSGVDVIAALSAALDRKMAGQGQRSDWGEIARETLVSAVCDYFSANGQSLFAATRSDLTAALAKSKHPPFASAVVDEAQDISVAHLRISPRWVLTSQTPFSSRATSASASFSNLSHGNPSAWTSADAPATCASTTARPTKSASKPTSCSAPSAST